MPVDAQPVANGNIILDVRRAGESVRTVAVYIAPLLETPEERAKPHYVSHFATCPEAAQHRRKP